MLRLEKTLHEREVNGEKKLLPMYRLVDDENTKLSVVIQPVFKESRSYFVLEMLSEFKGTKTSKTK